MKKRSLAALLAVLLSGSLSQPAGSATRAQMGAFRGIGAWIDIFDDAAWRTPEAQVADLQGRGVRILFLQTTSYRFPGPIRYPEPTGRFLDAARARGMRVVGWYVPGFDDLDRDLAWSVAAARFRSPGGARFDALGLDIEATKVRNHDKRSRRLVEFSRRLRAAVGPRYPLGAIIPSWLVQTPSGGEIAEGFWSNFPYAGIAPHYDVVLPMAYWTYRVKGRARTEQLIARSVQIIRERMSPRLPIHPIGGIANKSNRAEMQGFAAVVRRAKLLGASVYDAGTSGPEEWSVLAALGKRLAARSRQAQKPAKPRPAPVVLSLSQPPGKWAVDREASRLAGGDRVVYRFPVGGALRRIRVRAYDVADAEVVVTINGRLRGTLKGTPESEWGSTQTLSIPVAARRGRVVFDSLLNPPRSDPWGIQILGTSAIGPI
ncbi:MAG TPA: hypothetical protein VEA19_07745 [Actinomycetota bacterium]|nr:hypothetical protein [Actinomycetota bacterium]